MHGDLKYPKNFIKFDYANQTAYKGGTIKLSSIGTFDNLNPYILKGVAAWQTAYLFETLMKSSFDEPFSQYGLIAEGIKISEDRSWVKFKIRDIAKFSNGLKITPDDIVFSFNILLEKGHPIYKTYYGQVDNVKKISENEVMFSFKGKTNPELPLIIGYQLPIFSKEYWKNKDFGKTTLEAPIGSGPYLVSDVKAGRSITLKKNPDYWGIDLNVNKGRYNFEIIQTDYYRDETVALEAFKSGAYDFKLENSSKNWATAYDFKAVKDGKVKVEEIKYYRPSGMQGFAFNIRKNIFKNRNVRKALSYAFDFEWSNRNLFYGAYTRTKSFFDNSELSSQSLPNKKEIQILNKYKGKIPDEIFNSVFSPPNTELEDNSLKVVLLFEVLYMVPDPIGMIKKITEKMAPNGILFLSVRSDYYYALSLVSQKLFRNASIIEKNYSGEIFDSGVRFNWINSKTLNEGYFSEFGLILRNISGVGTLSGIPGDPLSKILLPSSLTVEESASLLELEHYFGDMYPDSGRYILCCLTKDSH